MRGVEVLERPAKSLLNRVDGMPFRWSVNPYRGCYHGCVFCYARRSHGYLDEDGVGRWQSRIFVKVNAPAVLRSELRRRSWRHERVAIGTVTDPYQPLEGRYKLMRGILEALTAYDTPATIITRSPLIVRDTNLLARLAKSAGVTVAVSIATLDAQLAREIEPTVAPPEKRLEAVRRMAQAGIDVSVALAPVLPHITDSRENISDVVHAAKAAGASRVWHNTLHLHEVTREAFFGYLRAKRPELMAEYANLYRAKYAPRELHERIDARVGAAIRCAPRVETYARLMPRRCEQLTLL